MAGTRGGAGLTSEAPSPPARSPTRPQVRDASRSRLVLGRALIHLMATKDGCTLMWALGPYREPLALRWQPAMGPWRVRLLGSNLPWAMLCSGLCSALGSTLLWVPLWSALGSCALCSALGFGVRCAGLCSHLRPTATLVRKLPVRACIPPAGDVAARGVRLARRQHHAGPLGGPLDLRGAAAALGLVQDARAAHHCHAGHGRCVRPQPAPLPLPPADTLSTPRGRRRTRRALRFLPLPARSSEDAARVSERVSSTA